METSTESQLPEFEVERFHIDEPAGSYDMLQVRCPRCRAEFWVRLTWRVLRPVMGASDKPPAYPFGRNCPECCRAAAIPEQWRVVEEEAAPKSKTRRVVRRRRSK